MCRPAVWSLLSLLLVSFAPVSRAAISASDYRASLLEIYGRYQGVLALREACNTASPQSRAENDKAFNAWQARHKKSHEELDQRISLMIRAYSKDDKDYARNFGKYQGAFLKQREEAKQVLLENRADLEIRCKGLPQFLQSRESDLETEFANEWLVLRQWQMPAK
jgi:hypothetical protein